MRFYIKRGAVLPRLLFKVLDEQTGFPVDLTGASVSFKMKSLEDGSVLVNAGASVVNPSQGLVEYAWSANDTATAGVCIGEFDILFPDGSTLTVPRKQSLEIWITEDVL